MNLILINIMMIQHPYGKFNVTQRFVYFPI